MDAGLKFLDSTDEVMEQISSFPKSGVPTAKSNIRKKIITKHTSVFYEIFEEIIELLHFWDNRQDPEKLTSLV